MTVLSIIVGVLLIIAGISLLATPLITFLGTGYFVIILFFVIGVFGVIRAIADKRYGIEFVFALLSLILGIVGFVVPGAALMNNFVMLYLAAGWFFVRGILSIVGAIQSRSAGAESGVVALGIILGVLELIVGVYSIIHPTVLAVAIGLLIGIYFIEAGINMILLGSIASRFNTPGGGNGGRPA